MDSTWTCLERGQRPRSRERDGEEEARLLIHRCFGIPVGLCSTCLMQRVRAARYCLSEAPLRRCKDSSPLAAIVFAPNVSRNQPHQPDGKMNSQPYATRQPVASMESQVMWGFCCRPNGKKTCRSGSCFSGLTASTLKVKRKVRPRALPPKVMAGPGWLHLPAQYVLPGHRPTRNSVPIAPGSPRLLRPAPRRRRWDRRSSP